MPQSEPQSTTVSLPLTQYTAAVYVVVVSVLYNFSFWSSFDINVFEYTDLTDLLKLALWPLLGFMLSFVIGVLLDQLVGNERRELPPAGGHRTRWQKIRVISNTFPELALIVVLTIGIFIQELAFGRPSRWLTGTFLAGSVVGFWLAGRGKLNIAGVPETLHSRTLTMLTLLPFLAFGYGKYNADNIRKGLNYTRVVPPSGVLSALGFPETTELRQLGNTGSYTIVLISSGPRVLVLANRELKGTELEHVQRVE